jgi:hypothetical protein
MDQERDDYADDKRPRRHMPSPGELILYSLIALAIFFFILLPPLIRIYMDHFAKMN